MNATGLAVCPLYQQSTVWDRAHQPRRASVHCAADSWNKLALAPSIQRMGWRGFTINGAVVRA